MKMKTKKGLSVAQLGGLALAFVIVAVIIGVGATIITEIQTGQTSLSIAYNVSDQGLEGLETMGDWLPTIAVIISAAVVIGVIVRYFQG